MTTENFKLKLSSPKLFWLLLIFLIFIAGSYLYLVNDLIFKAAERENLHRLSDRLTLEISALENQYLTLAETVTLERAYALGFEESSAGNAIFAVIATPRLALGPAGRILNVSGGHEE